jgi:predicted P-loop ATPase
MMVEVKGGIITPNHALLEGAQEQLNAVPFTGVTAKHINKLLNKEIYPILGDDKGYSMDTLVSYYPDLFKPEEIFQRSLTDAYKIILNGDKTIVTALKRIRKVVNAGGDRNKIKATIKPMKEKLPLFTFNGYFSQRSKESLVHHSGLCITDYDEFTNQDELEAEQQRIIEDKHTLLCFISPSGNGFKSLIRIPSSTAEEHTRRYHAYKEYINSKWWDDKNSDVSRACFLAKDQNAYLNQNADVFEGITPLKKKAPTKKKAPAGAKEATQDEKIKGLRKWVDDKHPIQDGQRNANLLTLSCALSEYGVSQSDAGFYCLAEYQEEGFDEKEVLQVVENGYKRTVFNSKEWITHGKNDNRASNKGVKKTDEERYKEIDKGFRDFGNYLEKISKEDFELMEPLEKLAYFVESNYAPIKNTLTGNITVLNKDKKRVEITDTITNSLFLKAKLKFDKVATKDVLTALLDREEIPTFCPVQKFYEDNKDYKTNNELDRICDTLISNQGMEGEEDFCPDYVKRFFKMWFASGVYQWLKDDQPSELMIALIGKQFDGKTYFFRNLLPKELLEYFIEHEIKDSFELNLALSKNLILLDDEAQFTRKTAVTFFKNTMSKTVLEYRPKYGKHLVKSKRMALIATSSNEGQIIDDPTGNRRIIPITLERIDQKAYNEIDKTALFIDTVNYITAGGQYKMTKEDIKLLNQNTKANEVISIEDDLVSQYCVDVDHKEGFSRSDLLRGLGGKNLSHKIIPNNLSKALKKAGYECKGVKVNGKKCNLYNCRI